MKAIFSRLHSMVRAESALSIVDYSILLAFISIITIFGITEFAGPLAG